MKELLSDIDKWVCECRGFVLSSVFAACPALVGWDCLGFHIAPLRVSRLRRWANPQVICSLRSVNTGWLCLISWQNVDKTKLILPPPPPPPRSLSLSPSTQTERKSSWKEEPWTERLCKLSLFQVPVFCYVSIDVPKSKTYHHFFSKLTTVILEIFVSD